MAYDSNPIELSSIEINILLCVSSLAILLAIIHSAIYYYVLHMAGLSLRNSDDCLTFPITFVGVYLFYILFKFPEIKKSNFSSIVHFDQDFLIFSLMLLNLFIPIFFWCAWDSAARNLILLIPLAPLGGIIDFVFALLVRNIVRVILSKKNTYGVSLYGFLWAFQNIKDSIKGDDHVESIYRIVPRIPRISKILGELEDHDVHDLFCSFVSSIDPNRTLPRLNYSRLEKKIFFIGILSWIKVSLGVILGIMIIKNIDIISKSLLLIFVSIIIAIFVILFVAFSFLVPVVIHLGIISFYTILGGNPNKSVASFVSRLGVGYGPAIKLLITIGVSIAWFAVF